MHYNVLHETEEVLRGQGGYPNTARAAWCRGEIHGNSEQRKLAPCGNRAQHDSPAAGAAKAELQRLKPRCFRPTNVVAKATTHKDSPVLTLTLKPRSTKPLPWSANLA